jgi:predicted HTH domain antitoxin
MIIELPDNEIEALKLSPEQARVELAVGLYAGRQVTLSRAAKIAGIAKVLFMQEIGRRGIGIHYTLEDLQHDIKMAEQLGRKVAA